MRTLMTVVLILGAVSCGSSCSGGTGAERVRSALDAFALAVEPSYTFAVDACNAQERAIAEEAKSGGMSTDQARAQLGPIRARCDQAQRAFDAIRKAHDAASERVAAGDVETAQKWMQKLRSEWIALQERGEDAR